MKIIRDTREDASVQAYPEGKSVTLQVNDHDGDYAVVWLNTQEANELATRLVHAASYLEFDVNSAWVEIHQ